jgi:hypothetical protein
MSSTAPVRSCNCFDVTSVTNKIDTKKVSPSMAIHPMRSLPFFCLRETPQEDAVMPANLPFLPATPEYERQWHDGRPP